MTTTDVKTLFKQANARVISQCKHLVADGVDKKTAYLINYKAVMFGYIDALLDLKLINIEEYNEFSRYISTLYIIYIR